MNAAYAIAAVPEPYQILGLRLKPFCLGHYLLLQRFECAFVSDQPAAPNIGDLLLAVFICSQSYEEGRTAIDQPDWLEEITAWGRHCGEFDPIAKIKLFVEYLRAGCEEPEVFFENNSKMSGAHWTLCLKTALMEMGYTDSQALNLPLTQAFSEFYKAAENKGVLTFAHDIPEASE